MAGLHAGGPWRRVEVVGTSVRLGMRWISIVLAVALVGAACTSDGDDQGSDDVGGGFVDAATQDARADEYLAAATAEFSPGSPLSVIAHAERSERDEQFSFAADEVTPDAFADMFAEIDDFEDTTDFDLLYLMNLWYGYRDLLPVETVAAIEERFLAYKYWYTEPTPEGVVDDKYYWSENHRIIFHTIEHLAGQAFPDETFTNDGRTGAEHRDESRDRILEWLDEKVRFGFSEWHSDVYYQKDLTPLLTLVEFAEDEEIADRAAMVLDLVLFDLASHLQDGNFGTTHGRSYMKDKSKATDQDTFAAAKLLFDDTAKPYRGVDAGAVLFARAARYRMPEVLARVATSDDTSIDRQRMGVPVDPLAPVVLDPEAPYGYDFDDPDNVPFWWERGAQTIWQVVPLTLDTLDRHELWDSQFYAPFQPLADLVGDDDTAAQELAQSLAPTLAFGLLSEVDTYTYRAPDVMLSTAQDHRPGVFHEQQHLWQATLDEDAVVFTTHPIDEPEQGTEWPDSDGYWTGTGSIPRSAQHGTAAIHMYAPQYRPDDLLPDLGYVDYTHAYFPQERFDEVVVDEGWTVGRRGDGYVALWSMRPAEFRDHPPDVYTGGLDEPFDLVARGGGDNTWIVEVGDAATWGSFDAFVDAVTTAEVEATARPEGPDGLPGGFDVHYVSPTEGEMTFGWDGPLSVDGEEVVLHDGPRIDNPWSQVDFEATRYEIADGDAALVLDFGAGTREVAAG